MVRQRQRKTIEELYGGKFDTTKSQVTTPATNNGVKTGRATERDYGYIITTNTASNRTGATTSVRGTTLNVDRETTRRKSSRPSMKTAEKFYGNEKEFQNTDDFKKELNSKLNTSRVDATRGAVSGKGNAKCLHSTSNAPDNMYDYGTHGNCNDPRHKDKHQAAGDCVQHHSRHHHSHDNHNSHEHNANQDDDGEEFFEIIRQTVESAIGKSISELLNRNFRELSLKVDSFSAELKNTNKLLSQIHTELNNKIVHYGEENSRNFRYLCMKSEYDKMFYQHQTMIATATPSNVSVTKTLLKPEKRKSLPKMKINITPQQNTSEDIESKSTPPEPCSCRSNNFKTSSPENEEPLKVSSGELSKKSSETSMREILEDIKKFCNKMQANDFKCNQPGTKEIQNDDKYNEDMIQINKNIFYEDDDEDDDYDESSDDMTPRCNEKYLHKQGGITTRTSGSTSRGGYNAGDV